MDRFLYIVLTIILLQHSFVASYFYDEKNACLRIADFVQSNKKLEDEGLILQLLTAQDAENIFRCSSDIETVQLTSALGNYPHKTIEETQILIKDFLKQMAEQEMLAFTITDTMNHEFLGIAIIWFTLIDAKAEFGIVLSKQFWGQGIGTRALKIMLNFTLKNLKLHRAEATCDPLNIGSKKMIEKSGMKFEGYLHKYYVVRGESKDRLMYALTYQDYELMAL